MDRNVTSATRSCVQQTGITGSVYTQGHTASTGMIDFSVYIEDSCPTIHKTCIQTCNIDIGCIAPVCNRRNDKNVDVNLLNEGSENRIL